MKKSIALSLLVIISISCKKKFTHQCDSSKIYKTEARIDRHTTLRFSPIYPGVFCFGWGKNRCQGKFLNDSLIIETYQDKLFPKYYVHDNTDSLIIQAGLNKRSFIYDQKKEEWHNLKSRTFTFIHLTETHILLFGYGGFFKVDKINFNISKVKDSPQEYFNRSPIVISDQLYFRSGWCFNVKTNLWIRTAEAIKQPSDLDVIYNDQGIRIRKRQNKYVIEQDSLTRSFTSKPIVRNKSVWYHEKGYFIKESLSDGKIEKFNLKIPYLKKENLVYKLHHNLIWIYTKSQVYFIDINSGIKYKANLDYDRLKEFGVQGCYAYILYNDEVILKPIANLLKEGIRFDLEKHIKEITAFKKLLRELTPKEPLNVRDAICIRDSIFKEFNGSSNPEINARLDLVEHTLISKVGYEIIELKECYNNTELSFNSRQVCLNNLIYTYGSDKNYKAISKIASAYSEITKNANGHDVYGATIDNILKYYFVKDSLKNSNLDAEELTYFNALNEELTCYAVYNCHGGCGGCDVSPVIDALESFVLEYPGSQYLNQAYTKLFELKTMYANDDFDFINQVRSEIRSKCETCKL